jgi:L-threonylcarbamoyladenylate synthase
MVLRQGGIIAHATEAVFGIAASAFDSAACERVALLKSRGTTQRFIVIGWCIEQLEALVSLRTPLRAEICASWPGPFTWILPARADSPPWLVDIDGNIAVRVTAHEQSAKLCRRAGPLISTSANLGGKPPARSLFTAKTRLWSHIDAFVPGVVDHLARPSQIRHGITGVLLRA